MIIEAPLAVTSCDTAGVSDRLATNDDVLLVDKDASHSAALARLDAMVCRLMVSVEP